MRHALLPLLLCSACGAETLGTPRESGAQAPLTGGAEPLHFAPRSVVWDDAPGDLLVVVAADQDDLCDAYLRGTVRPRARLMGWQLVRLDHGTRAAVDDGRYEVTYPERVPGAHGAPTTESGGFAVGGLSELDASCHTARSHTGTSGRILLSRAPSGEALFLDVHFEAEGTGVSWGWPLRALRCDGFYTHALANCGS